MNQRDYNRWTEFMFNACGEGKYTRAAFHAALRREVSQAKKDRRWEWKILDRKTKQFVGFIDVKTIVRDPQQVCDVGYMICEDFRGKGYSQEAVKELIPTIFKTLKFHRLEFTIDPKNKVSIKIAKALGLEFEGLRKHYWPSNYPAKGGPWIDQLVYATTPELWKPRSR